MKRFASVCLLALVWLARALPSWAQTPYLVSDVDPAVAESTVGNPRQLTPTASWLYLLADTPTGRGLARFSPGGDPSLVRQVPDLPVELVRVMTAAGERVFFTAQRGLWTSDGTAAGTSMIKQFAPPGFQTIIGAGQEIASVNGVAFFLVVMPSGPELWKSDGTAAGTVRVAPVLGRDLTPAGNRLFFTSSDTGLWTTDGTEAGTVRLGSVVVKDVLGKIAASGNSVLFIGSDNASGGGDLWRSDGTEAGTVRVKSFAPTSLPHSLTRLANLFLFAAGTPQGIWRTDGTETGTTEVKGGVTVRRMHAAHGTVFLHGRDAAAGNELWTTDGTAAGTAVVDVCPGACSFLTESNTSFATLPTGAAFSRRGPSDMWRTDGTVAGTMELGNPGGCGKFADELRSLTAFAGSVYFEACDATGGQTWKTDGTPGGTVRLTFGTAGASSSPTIAGDAGTRAIFAATRPDVGREIWSTAGSKGSTQLVADLTAGPPWTEWRGVASLGQLFTFTTTIESGGGGLWSTDGTPAGTREIGAFSVDYTRRAAVRQGLAVFAEGFPASYSRPFFTDGTPEGTFAVEPPPGGTEVPGLSLGAEAIAAHAGGFATVMGEGPTSFAPAQVWLTVDGQEPATRFTLPAGCLWGTSVDEKLFLACRSGGEPDLWISDGSHSGTRLVADLPAAPLAGWVALEGKLYFRVAGSPSSTLWSSDGTTAGTAPLSSIATVPVDPKGLTVSNGVLYFAGFTFETGNELWRTDGTAAGTFMLHDFDPGPASGISFDFEPDYAIAAVAGGVVFTATTGTRGAELWWSDGTQTGTTPLAQIAAGPASASPGSLHRIGSRVYFAANDGTRGREAWAIDFPAPNVSVGDVTVTEGDAGTTTASFAVHLDSPSGTLVTMSYATVAGSATAGVDFLPTSGALTFAPGARDLLVDVTVIGDVSDESHESFALQVTSVAGAALADGRGAAVILDDDLPQVAAAGASVVEGDSGIANASFPVTLTTGDGQPTTHAVVVRGEAVPGTAALEDFPPFGVAPVPTLSFPAGTPTGTTLPLLVPVRGDTLDEPNETFLLRLDGQNDAVVAAESPTGVILDDDGIDAAPPIELTHGTALLADLAPPAGRASDADFYLVQQHADASYEVTVDGISGDAVPLLVARVHPIGSALQWAQPVGTGNSVSMSWVGIGTLATQHVRVQSPACGSVCGSDDTYRLRFYETTLAAPRINNQGSQVTAVILQNTTTSPAAAVLTGRRPDGSFGIRSAVLTVPPRGTAVIDTTQEFPGFVGSLSVAHTAPYGTLVGKVVALDPATGLSFDTPLRVKPR